MEDTMVEVTHLKNILEEMVCFVQRFQWLHDFSMIKVLSNENCISKLPDDWKYWFSSHNYNIEEIEYSPYQGIDCPSLKDFLLKCSQFSIASLLKTHCQYISFESVKKELKHLINAEKNSLNLESLSIELQSEEARPPEIKREPKQIWNVMKRVCPKKKHEIEELSQFMNEIKKITHSHKIIDIGSGLGFLDLFLHLKYKYKVIGVEGMQPKIESASKLRDNVLKNNSSDVRYICWHLEDDLNTIEKCKEITADFSNDHNTSNCTNEEILTSERGKGVDLLSLHSCADLSTIMLNIFTNNPHFSSMVMIPCCYHKMKPLDTKDENQLNERRTNFDTFNNFPFSKSLIDIMEKREFRLNTFSLRLASEETSLHWRERAKDRMMDDVNFITYRSILQNICDKNDLRASKVRRHCCTKKASFRSFEDYLDLVFKDYKFRSLDGKVEYTDCHLLRPQLQVEYEDQKENLVYVGLIRSLQLYLQPVLESLILIDRVVYLRENGFNRSGIIQLFDEVKSPRNNAIFAFRNTKQ